MANKLLMVQEEHFIKNDKGEIYATRVLNEKIFNRYLEYFDEVIVFARVSKSNNVVKELKVNTDRLSFIEIPDFRGPKEMLMKSIKIVSKFRKACSDAEVIFLRAPSMLTIFLYRFIPKNKITSVEFMMGATYFIEDDSFIAKKVNKIIDNEAKKLVKKANATLYVTEEALQKEYPPNAKAYEDSNDDYFTCGVSDVVIEKEYLFERLPMNSESNHFILISVGFMDSYRKGQHILIETVKILKDKGYSIELRLIGEGKKKEEFEQLAKRLGLEKEVLFLGKISSRETLFQQLKESDIFLLPSKLEGLPRVIIEALSASLPVIASDVNGNSELVQSELLVQDFEASNYSEKIQELIENPVFYNDISKENYQKALEYLPDKLDLKRRLFFEKLSILSKKQK
ncbi:glycosyltransferase [Enterococcus sp. DIV1314a]|uniref:glycosyltransferase n=1 Tax=Enterococcus sp. DIV1314a TaxID=2774660 RepID=UPI003F6845A0